MGPAGATVDPHWTITVFGVEGTQILLVAGRAMVDFGEGSEEVGTRANKKKFFKGGFEGKGAIS